MERYVESEKAGFRQFKKNEKKRIIVKPPFILR